MLLVNLDASGPVVKQDSIYLEFFFFIMHESVTGFKIAITIQ